MSKKALEESIEHWNRLANAPDALAAIEEGISGENCALCTVYAEDRCSGCPVANHTGFIECRNSPYFDARRIFNDMRFIVKEKRGPAHGEHVDAFTECAGKELKFLIEVYNKTYG